MRYYLGIMAHFKQTTTKEPLKVYTIKLTPTSVESLTHLGQEASDALGWTVSSSAMIRALIRQAGKQPPAWARSELHPLVEEEIAQGRVWGSKKKNKL